MKSIKQTTPAKKIALSILVLVLLSSAIAFGIFAKQNHIWPFGAANNAEEKKQDINYKPATNDQKDEGERIKERSVEDNNSDTHPTSGEKEKAAVTITSAEQTGDKLRIRFLIQAVDSGSCTLNLTKGEEKLTETSATQAFPSSMTCRGFDIPISKLSPGEWTYTMSFAGSSHEGTATDKVMIK